MVAVLIRRPAARAVAADQAVGQEHASLWVVGLHDVALGDMATLAAQLVDALGVAAVFLAVGRVVAVEVDAEALEIRKMAALHLFDHRLGLLPPRLGAEHDGGAVGVVGAQVDAVVPAQALEARPDVRLDALEDVPQVQWAVGVGQGAGDEHPGAQEGGDSRAGHSRGGRWRGAAFHGSASSTRRRLDR